MNQTNIVTFPMLVDMEVEDRLVTGTFNGSEISEEFAKDMAVANAIKQAGADVLVDPFYDISISNQNISVTVIGHPAHYGNFRKAVPDMPSASAAPRPSIKPKPETQTKERFEQKTYEPPAPKREEPPIREEEVKQEERIIEEEPAREEPQPEIADAPEPPAAEEEPIPAIEEREEAPAVAYDEPEPDNNRKLVTPCYIIGYSAMAKESDARDSADQLIRKGLKAGYFWIPDYDRAGKNLFRVYVGPYTTRDEADSMLPRVKLHNGGAYVMQLK